MTESWTIAHADLCCLVRWDGTNLLWQLQHPQAPGGATEWTPIGEMCVDYRPVRWTRLVSAVAGPDKDGVQQLDVVLEDEAGRLRLTRSFQLFASHPFARTWAIVQNTGAGAIKKPLTFLRMATGARYSPTAISGVISMARS